MLGTVRNPETGSFAAIMKSAGGNKHYRAGSKYSFFLITKCGLCVKSKHHINIDRNQRVDIAEA